MIEWTDEEGGRNWRASATKPADYVDVQTQRDDGSWSKPLDHGQGTLAVYRQLEKVTGQLEARARLDLAIAQHDAHLVGAPLGQPEAVAVLLKRVERLEADVSDDDQLRGDLDGQAADIEANRKRIAETEERTEALEATCKAQRVVPLAGDPVTPETTA